MTTFRSIGAGLENDGSGTEPIDVRKDLAGVFTGPGVLPGGVSPLVTGTSAWSYQVGRCNLVTSRGVTSDGVHLWGNDGAVTIAAADDGTSLAAPGTSGTSRIDIVYALHPSNGENSDTTSQPYFAVRKGTAASSPQPPTLPAGALELARNTMTAAATSTTSTGNSIQQTAARSSTRGGWRLIGLDRRGADSASFTTTEVAILSVTGVVTDGLVKLQLSGNLNSTVAGDLVNVRVRDGNATSGTVLLEGHVRIFTAGSPGTTEALMDYATLSPGQHTFWVTAQRIAGTGTCVARAGYRMTVDDGPTL